MNWTHLNLWGIFFVSFVVLLIVLGPLFLDDEEDEKMPKIGDAVYIPAIIVKVDGDRVRVHIGSELMPTAITVPASTLIPGNRRQGMDGLTSALLAYHDRRIKSAQEAISGE
jgi:hypothetical protein